MICLSAAIAEILQGARRSGEFFAHGTAELLPPSLSIDPIALPLLPTQAAELVAASERAPYGRGPETIIDTEVRNSWQISPGRVAIGGRHWPKTLAAIIKTVAEGLGVSDEIEAELYKLLIYEKGSFFVSHRDTEKTPGMFATLVVVLPSSCTGGELVVRHKERAVTLDLRSEDPAEVAFAAFYADCLHEVLPVTAGHRLTLVYNLIRRGKGRPPQPPDYTSEQDRIAALLRAWGDDDPKKLVYPLEHAYTAPELGFAVLKGADAAAATVLAAATRQAGCTLHLALLTVEDYGTAEYSGYHDSRRGWSRGHVEDDFEVGEVQDGHTTLSDWHAGDGRPASWGDIRVDEEELSPPDPFGGLDPDELHFEEASGNAGVSFERRYRRAALVIWPEARGLEVLIAAGLGVAVPHFGDLVRSWEAAGADRASPAWEKARDFAGALLNRWTRDGAADKHTSAMLAALAQLGDLEVAAAFLTQVICAGGPYAKSDNPPLVTVLCLFPPEQAGVLLRMIVAANGAKRFAACADLLLRVASRLPIQHLADPAQALLAAMPIRPMEPDWSATRDKVEPGFVADLLDGLGLIDPALANRAAAQVLQHPKMYDLDAILVPAVRDRPAPSVQSPAWTGLRAACLAQLRARIALPLEAPKDWRRESMVGCRCAHCRALSNFLADPAQGSWVFRAAEADRRHVQSTILTAKCDIATTTDQRGRPYSLVCKKTLASHERRTAQRRQDLRDEAALSA